MVAPCPLATVVPAFELLNIPNPVSPTLRTTTVLHSQALTEAGAHPTNLPPPHTHPRLPLPQTTSAANLHHRPTQYIQTRTRTSRLSVAPSHPPAPTAPPAGIRRPTLQRVPYTAVAVYHCVQSCASCVVSHSSWSLQPLTRSCGSALLLDLEVFLGDVVLLHEEVGHRVQEGALGRGGGAGGDVMITFGTFSVPYRTLGRRLP